MKWKDDVERNNKIYTIVNEMVCLIDGNVKRIIVPYVLRKKLIQQWHSDPISNNHLGFEKTYDKMAKQFYWEGMKEDVRAACQSCQPANSENRHQILKEANH